jgi:membrane-associated phospholipid phosphatase
MTFVSATQLPRIDRIPAAVRRWVEVVRAEGMHPAIQRRNIILWCIVIAMVVLQAPLIAFGPFSIDAANAGQLALFMAFLGAASTLMLKRYRDPFLGLAMAGYAQMTSVSIVGVAYSYFAASLAMPWQDELFMAMDRAIGFDWMALMQWMSAERWRLVVAAAAYIALAPQIMAVVPLLVLFRRFHKLQVFILAWFFSATATVSVFALLPAVSTFEHLGIVDHMKAIMPVSGGFSHLPDLLAARAHEPLALYGKPEGMIAFPSFHACGGMLLMWAFWQVRLLRWPAVAVNALMIAATPVIGGHYLVDVIAGVLLALGSIALASRLMPPPEPVAP